VKLAPSIFDGGAHLLILDGFCPGELDAFTTAEPDLRVTRAIAHAVDLASIRASGGTVLEALRRGTVSKIRRSMRLLEAEYGPVQLEWADSPAQADDIFTEMCVIHNARWRSDGRAGVFESTRFDGFHRQLIARLLPEGRVLLARVKAGGTTIGCDYDFVERGRVLGYQWGIRHFEENAISAGLVVGATVMQAALERGFDEYDWLAGDVLYKRMLATDERELTWASRPIGPMVPMLDAATRIKRSVEETINRQRGRVAA
jgi:CelD/BcsL family acetyltransferase involved in cellulose biosynthesis